MFSQLQRFLLRFEATPPYETDTRMYPTRLAVDASSQESHPFSRAASSARSEYEAQTTAPLDREGSRPNVRPLNHSGTPRPVKRLSSVFGIQRCRLLVGALCLLLLSLVSQANAQATSREEEIRQQRTDKRARLWPERTSGIVSLFDKYTESGLFEGARSKKGKNGTQFLLGGMRSGNGTTFGVGYRRIDFWDEKVAFRVTARGR